MSTESKSFEPYASCGVSVGAKTVDLEKCSAVTFTTDGKTATCDASTVCGDGTHMSASGKCVRSSFCYLHTPSDDKKGVNQVCYQYGGGEHVASDECTIGSVISDTVGSWTMDCCSAAPETFSNECVGAVTKKTMSCYDGSAVQSLTDECKRRAAKWSCASAIQVRCDKELGPICEIKTTEDTPTDAACVTASDSSFDPLYNDRIRAVAAFSSNASSTALSPKEELSSGGASSTSAVTRM